MIVISADLVVTFLYVCLVDSVSVPLKDAKFSSILHFNLFRFLIHAKSWLIMSTTAEYCKLSQIELK